MKRVHFRNLGQLLLGILLINLVWIKELKAQEISLYPSEKYALKLSQTKAKEGVATIVQHFKAYSSNKDTLALMCFVWVANNIAYDVSAFHNPHYKGYTSKKVLVEQKAVCSGYTVLMSDLLNALHIPNMEVVGYALYNEGYNRRINEANHSWIAFKTDKWYLMDATWGAGYTNAEVSSFRKVYNRGHFKPSPKKYVEKHLPEVSWFQLLSPAITIELYRKPLEEFRNMDVQWQEYPKFGNDSLNKLYAMEAHQRKEKMAKEAYKTNPDNALPLARFYYDKGYRLQLHTPQISKWNVDSVYRVHQEAMGAYRKSLLYYTEVKERGIKNIGTGYELAQDAIVNTQRFIDGLKRYKMANKITVD